MTARNDADLVAECIGGSNPAFETLMRKYYRPVYNVALRMLKEPTDAEDIAQTVFIKAYEKLDTYNPRHQFFSWIYRIAINESINASKKTKRLDEYESGVSAALKETQVENVGQDELAEALDGAITLLTVDYRMVIVLRHYHDFTYEEMGEILDIPEKTVKSRLFTARQRLKEILEKQGVVR